MARIVFCAFLLVVCCSVNVFGQAASSPFSAFGIGDYNQPTTASQQGMAGVGVSNPEYLFINTLNPALLVYNGRGGITTFQAGILGETRNINDGTNKDKSGGGNLNYLAIAFPIKSFKWVTSITLSPYSTLNYKYTYSQVVNGTQDTLHFQEQGTGGINQVAWSHGIALHKNISIGARASYLYSTIENKYSNTIALGQQLLLFQPDVTQRYYYRGFLFTGGVSVHLDSLFRNKRKNYVFNVGATYDLNTELKTDYLQTLVRTTAASTVSTDTLKTSNTGRTKIPSMLQAGISFGQGTTWMFAIDARMTDYTKFGFVDTQATPTTKGWRAAAGFQLTPNPASLSSYLKVITYRIGAIVEQSPYLANGNYLKSFGTTFGLSLPVSRGCSLDLSGQWGKRGDIETNTIMEKYFKVFFGVSFNDRWFIKRKFD